MARRLRNDVYKPFEKQLFLCPKQEACCPLTIWQPWTMWQCSLFSQHFVSCSDCFMVDNCMIMALAAGRRLKWQKFTVSGNFFFVDPSFGQL